MVQEPLHLQSPTINVRKVASIEECRDVEAVMAAIWGPEGVVPYHMTFKLARYGGLVLGAYAGDQMVGFVLSFTMFQGGRAGLYLHLLGVLARWRSSRIGVQLMLDLGKEALGLGYSQIAWTYDPLESSLANLYLGKLGGTCNAYQTDYYGPTGDRNSRGLAADRFLVKWCLRSANVAALLDQNTAAAVPEVAGGDELSGTVPAINHVEAYRGALPIGSDPELDLDHPELLLYIPADLQALRRADLPLACRWREQTRAAFTHYFSRGYNAVGFTSRRDGPAYILRRGVSAEAMAAMQP